MRKTRFQNGEYYHIYNRGVDKRKIFNDRKNYLRFLRSMKEFNYLKPVGSLYQLNKLKTSDVFKRHRMSKLVDFVCYCLLPNHFHLLLKQLSDNGISELMRKLGNGYTKHFNYKNNRTGPLFSGKYKTVPIKTDEQLVYVSAYINGNAQIHKIAKAEKWPWSSYQDYLSKRSNFLCYKSVIIDQFKDIKDYKSYVDIVIKDSSSCKDEIRRYLLEE